MTEIDIRVFRFLHEALGGIWTAPMAALTVIGGGWGALFVVPLVASARTRRLGNALAIVLAVTAVVVFALKRIVARARPCACLPDVRARVWAAPTDFSFPSGHAAGSFAFAVFLAIVVVRTMPPDRPRRERAFRCLGAAILGVLAVGVALSRVALGVHFPGDVLAGAIVGATVAGVGASFHLGAAGPGAGERSP